MSYDNWKLTEPDRYEIDDENGNPIAHDPDDDDDDCDSDIDTPIHHDHGDPVGFDECLEEMYADHRHMEDAEIDRLNAYYDRTIRTMSKGDYL